ncbi:hypothetical protein YB2330_002542 [Saitoella coloradoensis]
MSAEQTEPVIPQAEEVPAVEVAMTEEVPAVEAPKIEEAAAETTTAPDASAAVAAAIQEQDSKKTNFKTNSKFDPSDLPVTSDPAEILKQIEFYFSDANFPYDKFLFTTAWNNDGWVPIATIAAFKRCRRFQPFEAIVSALKTSEKLLVSTDDTKVKRKNELNRVDPKQRTLHVRGLDREESKTLQIDLEKYFEQFGPIDSLRLKREEGKGDEAGKFKGSFDVMFSTEELAKTFYDLAEKPTLPGLSEGASMSDVNIETKEQQYARKAAEGSSKPRFFKRFNGFEYIKQLEQGGNGNRTFGSQGRDKRKREIGDAGDNQDRRGGRGRGRGRGGRGRGRGGRAGEGRGANNTPLGEKAGEGAPAAAPAPAAAQE